MLLLNISLTLIHQSQKEMETHYSYLMAQVQPLPNLIIVRFTYWIKVKCVLSSCDEQSIV